MLTRWLSQRRTGGGWMLLLPLLLQIPTLEAQKKPVPPKQATSPEAASVLILVNEAVPAAEGTAGMGASVWVGTSYAEKRGIPASNILHLNIPNTANPLAWDSRRIPWERFDSAVRQPVLERLNDADEIHYIVPVFGVPTHISRIPDTPGEGWSIDSFLASIQSGQTRLGLPNPYRGARSGPELEGVHFQDWSNPAGWKMYLVTRLDGPTPQIAVELVDKAMRAERNLQADDGTAYFDFRNITCCGGYYQADQTVQRASQLSAERGFRQVFNDQTVSKHMIQSAPEALWAWGWYSGPVTNDVYEFVEGAVGAQLTSYTADDVRVPRPGAWVELWLRRGITATWGATTEPTVAGYANGDDFFRYFWSGMNFAESSYRASPMLNHTMVFVGDPLYAPEIFRKPPTVARLVNAASGEAVLAPGGLATLWGEGLANCAAAAPLASELPVSLCGASVVLNGVAAPLLYASPTQINLLIPQGLRPATPLSLEVSRANGGKARLELPPSILQPAAAAVFQVEDSEGSLVAALTHADSRLCDRQAPLRTGETGVLYVSGLGAIEGVLADSARTPYQPLLWTRLPVELYINQRPQTVLFAGLTPGLAGVYQVNFRFDAGTPLFEDGQNRLWLKAGDAESPHVPAALAF